MMTATILIVAAVYVVGVATGLRYRVDETRRLTDQVRYGAMHAVDIRRLDDALNRTQSQLARWRDTYYTARANRHGWNRRLP
jgi:hypothetical protein